MYECPKLWKFNVTTSPNWHKTLEACYKQVHLYIIRCVKCLTIRVTHNVLWAKTWTCGFTDFRLQTRHEMRDTTYSELPAVTDRVLSKHASGHTYNGCLRLNADLGFIDTSLVKLAAKLLSREVRNDDYGSYHFYNAILLSSVE